jgi:hypothetical protein
MSPEQLSGVKSEVQKILDNHLEEDQRFSIQDLDEESTFLLIDLLLEKDDLEREHIRAKIHEKITTSKMDLELDYERIMEIKDKLNYLKNDFNDLDDLKNTVNTDSELGNQLNSI